MNQLEIQFQGESPSGPFTIRKPFSVMTAYYVPRDKIKAAREMKGINRYGIYCLYGSGRIYIGQTRNGIDRIMEHTRGKQFWDEAVLFLADPINFNLNIISGLERHAIEEAIGNSPYEVENKTVPQYETISDFEREQILTIFDEISFIMEFVGIRTKEGKKPSKTHIQEDTSVVDIPRPSEDGHQFHTRKKGSRARLAVIDGAFVVLAGSSIDINTPLLPDNLSGKKRRQDALANGVIKKLDNDTYILMENVAFTSPSSAAEFVMGSSRNGRIEWIDDSGTNLGDFLSTIVH